MDEGKEEKGEAKVVGVMMGSAYIDEEIKTRCVIGNALYRMSVELLEKLLERAELVLFLVRDTLHQ
ncbi:hypothetical protein Theth_0132 [Pseudothermotoga thermarum DSM 5069]|uniref:Uncharacterized protein n=1 Tax=Pseudothermotoga thermarum DSM 5069 TaxID=688269 RepID=F7YUQ1_9THEM|nr:hypothetical protein Theth_0132 [Pseudothermotoga thermarum DSM 5069]